MSDVVRYPMFSAPGQPERDYVLAADYDAQAAELATERLRADAAVGDANAAEQRAAELEGLLRKCRIYLGGLIGIEIDAALAGQPQHGTPEWPKEQCPVTGAIRDVDPADLGDQQQGEQCSTCRGTGEIDQRLGGEWNSPVVPCPDCDGEGEPDDNWIMSPCSQGHTDVGAAGGIAHCYICGESVTGETTEEAWRKWEITHAHFKAEQPAAVDERRDWSCYDTTFLLEHIRRDTNFDADLIGAMLKFSQSAQPVAPDWRTHSAQFARGEKCPETLETLQAAWTRDQELIFDQKAQISRIKETVNDLRQKLAAQPVAVVMPERMTTIPEGKTISYAAGYEAALDAVANLNRNTVPLELLEIILDASQPGAETGVAVLRDARKKLRAILGAKP